MRSSSEPPELTDGAVALLRIAIENDDRRAIARNAALLLALKFIERSVRTCASGDRDTLAALLGVESLPPRFLTLVSLSLRALQRGIDEMYASDSDSTLPVMSDFNIHVLQALALALADAAWPKRAAADFDGPGLEEVIRSLARIDSTELSRLLLQHYLGNILQDVFASARIRDQVSGLPADTEVRLRTEDARVLSRYVVAECEAQPDGVHPAGLMLVLKDALGEVTA